MWWRRSWFSLKRKVGVRGQRKGGVLPHPALSTNRPANPCNTASQASWLVAGIVPGIERHPLKKLEPNEGELLRLLMRWRAEATKMGCTITRIAVAYEAGRDGFWLARWLRARDLETYVIHPTSVAVSREHRRAKTDPLDTGLLKRVFIGWLRE